MLNFLINFSIITFICYAVSGSVRAILFPKKRRQTRRRAYASQRVAGADSRQTRRVYAAQPKKTAKIIAFRSKTAARRNLRAA